MYMRTFLFFSFLLAARLAFGQCSVSLGDDITQCNGNPVTLTAMTTGTASQDSLRIVYDATQGVSGLVGAPKVYFHSGVQTVPFGPWEYVVGNWGMDDGIGEMTPLGNDLWQITIHVPSYYGYPNGTNVIGLWMVFRNADGTLTGKDDNDQDIFLNTSNGNTSTFSGITASVIPGSAGSLLWSTGDTTQSITVTASGTYSVTFTDGVGCQSSDGIEVEFGSGNVLVDLGPDTVLCNGQTIVLDAGAGYVSYEWSTMETGQTLEVALPGDYSVTVTDAMGCTGIDLIHIGTGASPLADFSYAPLSGTTVQFTETGIGATTVYWDFDGNGTIDATSAANESVTHDFGAESVFGVVMIAENPCGTDTTSQNVLVQDVGVEEWSQTIGLQVYPNPATRSVTVSISDPSVKLTDLRILDVRGRTLAQWPVNTPGNLRVPLDRFRSGVYVLSVHTSEGTINQRLIKH